MKERICYVVGAGENYGLDFQPVTGLSNGILFIVFPKEAKERIIK